MIRYFKVDDFRYYAIAKNGGYMLHDNSCAYFTVSRATLGPEYFSDLAEISAPKADFIEELYINATDRPSVDGFKYPELGWWASFERLGVTSVKFPFEADLGLSIGSKVRLYDGREGK